MAHEPLHYATFKGPGAYALIGTADEQRGYPAGQTVQIGQGDAERIRAQDTHAFELVPVPAEIIGTAEETQPLSGDAAQALNLRLSERDA